MQWVSEWVSGRYGVCIVMDVVPCLSPRLCAGLLSNLPRPVGNARLGVWFCNDNSWHLYTNVYYRECKCQYINLCWTVSYIAWYHISCCCCACVSVCRSLPTGYPWCGHQSAVPDGGKPLAPLLGWELCQSCVSLLCYLLQWVIKYMHVLVHNYIVLYICVDFLHINWCCMYRQAFLWH